MADKPARRPPIRSLSPARKVAALGGFVVFGLLPSYVDFQEKPEQRAQMIGAYVVGLGLFYYGLLS